MKPKMKRKRRQVARCPVCDGLYGYLNLHVRYLAMDGRVLRADQVKGAGPVRKVTTHEISCAKKHRVDLWALKAKC